MNIKDFLNNDLQTFSHADDRDSLPCHRQKMSTSLKQLEDITTSKEYANKEYRLVFSIPLMPSHYHGQLKGVDDLLYVNQFQSTFYMYPKTHQMRGSNIQSLELPFLSKFPNLVAYYVEDAKGPLEQFFPRWIKFSTCEDFSQVWNDTIISPRSRKNYFNIPETLLSKLSTTIPLFSKEGLLSLFYDLAAKPITYNRNVYNTNTGKLVYNGEYNARYEPEKVLAKEETSYFILSYQNDVVVSTSIRGSKAQILQYINTIPSLDIFWIVPESLDYVLAIYREGDMYLDLR